MSVDPRLGRGGVDRVRVLLGGVEETLLIPLYARAVETHKAGGMLRDPRAVEMVEALDYDFDRFSEIGSLAGACLRTLVFDHWVERFLDRWPGGTVIEIGTGLNTRFERVDNGRVQWFDLDLPDAIAARRRFFADHERRTMIAASVLDWAWTEQVLAAPGPFLLVAEAALAFLTETQVRQVYAQLGDRFTGSELIVDTAGRAMFDAQDDPDVLGTVTARMSWCCDDPQIPEQWHPNVRLVESIDFTKLPGPVWANLNDGYRDAMRAYAATEPDRAAAYRINHYQLD